jgi:hypothetical protein
MRTNPRCVSLIFRLLDDTTERCDYRLQQGSPGYTTDMWFVLEVPVFSEDLMNLCVCVFVLGTIFTILLVY